MHVIYKINFSNGKVYIGQSNDFTARRNQHLSVKSGFFENYSEISIKNIINYKTYTNI